MKFENRKISVTKITDVELDAAITEFLLAKLDVVLSARQKRHGYYDGYEYCISAANNWNIGDVQWFRVTAESPGKIKCNMHIEELRSGRILNWMCLDGVIPSGEYLIEAVRDIYED